MSKGGSPESFEVWLLLRVAEAVEAGEVSGDLLVELQAELGMTRAQHPACGHVAALRSLVDLLGVDSAAAEGAQGGWAVLRAASREQLLRDVAEIWLAEQRKAYSRRRMKPPSRSGS